MSSGDDASSSLASCQLVVSNRSTASNLNRDLPDHQRRIQASKEEFEFGADIELNDRSHR